MANPANTACPAGTWTKIGTNITVTNGSMWRMNTRPFKYLFTYRLTGEAKPTLKAEGVPIFVGVDSEPLNGSGIDIYIWAVGFAGSVTVHA